MQQTLFTDKMFYLIKCLFNLFQPYGLHWDLNLVQDNQKFGKGDYKGSEIKIKP